METTGHIGISYNFAADVDFVEEAATYLTGQGVPTWFIGRRGPDWHAKNWQGEFIDAMVQARGVIVVLSEAALPSIDGYGRGMWTELPIVRFLGEDDPARVLLLKRFPVPVPEGYSAFRALGPMPSLADPSPQREALISWAQAAMVLPQVPRPEVPAEQLYRSAASPAAVFEKSGAHTWYELERLDLHDEVWRCRRCGLKSEPYIRIQENPPSSCPRCGFEGRSSRSAI